MHAEKRSNCRKNLKIFGKSVDRQPENESGKLDSTKKESNDVQMNAKKVSVQMHANDHGSTLPSARAA